MYSISDVAKFFNISTQTLRYYDRIGLLHPQYVDPKTSYRYYTLDDFNTLHLIRELKGFNFTLQEIQDYCKNKDIRQLEQSLKRKQRDIQQEISSLRQISERISFYEDSLQLSGGDGRGTKCSIREFPVRYAYMIQVDFDMDTLEQYISMAYQSYLKSPDMNKKCKRGHIVLTISLENICQQQFRTYNGVGILTNRPLGGVHGVSFVAGQWAVLKHIGGYDTIHRSYQRLNNYLYKEGYKPIDCAAEISVTNITLTKNSDQFITELQIPVSKKSKDV